jgi:hypothetical protein
MSTFEHLTLQRSPPCGLSDPLAVGVPRQVNGFVSQLRNEMWIVRLAVCCGFAGAVLLQLGLFSLFARLVLVLDAAVLPDPAASAYCAILGAAVMLANRALNPQSNTASRPPTRSPARLAP